MEVHLETLLQVETTMSKGIMRVTTTALGGGAAAAVMLRPVIATNPYILMVIILAFDFVVALFMLTQFKYAGAKFPQTLIHLLRHLLTFGLSNAAMAVGGSHMLHASWLS